MKPTETCLNLIIDWLCWNQHPEILLKRYMHISKMSTTLSSCSHVDYGSIISALMIHIIHILMGWVPLSIVYMFCIILWDSIIGYICIFIYLYICPTFNVMVVGPLNLDEGKNPKNRACLYFNVLRLLEWKGTLVAKLKGCTTHWIVSITNIWYHGLWRMILEPSSFSIYLLGPRGNYRMEPYLLSIQHTNSTVYRFVVDSSQVTWARLI